MIWLEKHSSSSNAAASQNICDLKAKGSVQSSRHGYTTDAIFADDVGVLCVFSGHVAFVFVNLRAMEKYPVSKNHHGNG